MQMSATAGKVRTTPRASRARLRPVLGPGLRRLLAFVLLLFALLAVNSLFLGGVTFAELLSGKTYQDYFYLLMFLVHLALGLLLIAPFLIFGLLHLRRAWTRPNRYAVRAGLGLYTTALVLLGSGLVLTRFGFLEINDPDLRAGAYWLHVATPLLVAWLFVLHRLAGPRLRWRTGAYWTLVGTLVAGLLVSFQIQPWAPPPTDAEPGFLPALSRIEGGASIPASHLMRDDFCAECHRDIAAQTSLGMHRLSSFNNPAYRFSIDEVRRVVLARDGNLNATRLCAACHDLVPLFAGRFADPGFDPDRDPSAYAGITCAGCHAIARIDSPLGNGAYSIQDPPRYPFAFSDNPVLKAVNRQLIKAKPAFHKHTYLKPIHRSAEFCSACHKVHIPFALNHYRWLRGQDHYDSFLSSGVSGHRVDSFYYPPRAVANCAHCHMPLRPSADPAARDFAHSGSRSVHDHGFAAANTGVPWLTGMPEQALATRREFMRHAARLDLFGIREQGRIDGELHAPLRPTLPTLEAGGRYLLETVIRTLRIGHQLTQGTSDSNELWLEVRVSSGGRTLAHSGGLDQDGTADPWAYFLNSYLLDRDGQRIERRNAQDIFVALYDHQIPPGAASVVHYLLEVPSDLAAPLTVEVSLRYRKFNSAFLRHVQGGRFRRNDLPIVTLATDRMTFPVANAGAVPAAQSSPVAAWERWNDYGIGLLRQGNRGSTKGALRQAEAAFQQVEDLGRGDGAVNLARLYFKEGRLDEASAALHRAVRFDPPAPAWTRAWFTALVEHQRGNLDAAIADLEAIANTRFGEARTRGFDFSRDVRVLNELGRTLYERARRERGAARRANRQALLGQSRSWLERTLAVDPENQSAHYNLTLVYTELGDPDAADRHRRLHQRYRPDDNAVERAVTLHRGRNPAANHAANPIAIYALQRPGAPRHRPRAQIAMGASTQLEPSTGQ